MGFATDAIHAGQKPDPTTGAIMPPIYATSTYALEELGRTKGYDYARTINPTRLALENNVPIVERKELARAIFKDVEIGQPIPSEQFAAMAEVLRFVYELQGKSLPTLGDVA